jgi:hypothetical protein
MKSQGNTEQKEKTWSYHNTQLQTILQSHSNKNSMYWHKNRYEGQWNRMEDSEINPHSYAHLVFDKAVKSVQWRKEPLQQMLLGKVVICRQKTETRSMPASLY